MSRSRHVARDADRPLSKEELARIRGQLAFLRRYRKVLRLRLNATEARLVDGSLAPDRRGVVQRLLSKIDRNAIEAALVRKPLSDSATGRAEFLAGAAGVSADVGVLLDALEAAVEVQTQEQAARAFAQALERVDFTGLSAARLSRLLALLERTHTPADQAHVLFGLLRSATFRKVFDADADALKPEVAATFLPLRAAWAATRKQARVDPRLLEEGLRRLIGADADGLVRHPPSVRERLVEVALGLDATWPPTSPGVQRLLAEMRAEGAPFRRLAVLCARRLAQQARYDDAIGLLDRVARAHPDALEATVLADQLRGTRVGTYAVTAPPARLTPALDLALMRPAYVSALPQGPPVHPELCLPGVAPVLGWDEDHDPPYLAVTADLPRLADLIAQRGQDWSVARAAAVATDGCQILSALATVGVELPDVAPDRFLLDPSPYRPHLVLADLGGALQSGAARAEVGHRGLAQAWVFQALSWPPLAGRRLRREVPPHLRDALERPRSQAPDPAWWVPPLLGLR